MVFLFHLMLTPSFTTRSPGMRTLRPFTASGTIVSMSLPSTEILGAFLSFAQAE